MPLLSTAQLDTALAVRDLTDPAAAPHALQTLVSEVGRALARAWATQVRLIRAPRIVSVSDNYEQLGYPPDAVTRDARYSRYLSADQMLRSHTSAGVPGALRDLAGEPAPPRDVLLVLPGLCYRRDSIDRLHTGTPHQLDLWRVTRAAPMALDDLVAMVDLVVDTLLPGRVRRLIPAEHPYTHQGRQIDVLDGDRWVEVGECGLASPALLARSGLSPLWSGLAMGLGLDRLLMLRKGIPDIRLLRSTDPRVEEQMGDLSAYRPVSQLPPVSRDLSVAVSSAAAPAADAEEGWAEVVGDRVREALGADAELLESVRVLTQTRYADLPLPARQRLGITPDQVNLLVRMVLRPLGRTLTDAAANAVRDRVYAALHEGKALAGPVAGPVAVAGRH
jgi:phenylalanyl-tRNA synthetase alpha chain